jgi:allantoinase
MNSNYDLVVKGTLVLPDRNLPDGWIAVSGGRIAAIGGGTPPPAKSVHDAGSDYVLPGFVDGQTHATSAKGMPGIQSTTRSAVAGGVTTLVDMPYDNPDPLNTLELLDAKKAAVAQYACCDIALYGTIVPGQGNGDMEALVKGGVAAFKISSFEAHPVRFPRLSSYDMLGILEAGKALGLPVGLHNEDDDIVNATTASLKALGKTTPEWHSPSRPVSGEMAATAAFLELGAATGAHVHIVHISHPRGYDLVRRYRDEGVNATAEMCAHYLHFDADRDIGRLGARMKVNPPIRGGVRAELWNSFRDGKIAFVSSDHASWPITNKLTPSIFDAGAGIPGLETLAPSFYTDLVAEGIANPVRAVADYLATKPARFFGLSAKGELRIGADADFAILSPRDVRFDASRTHDELNWSPYDQEVFKIAVAATFVRGKLAWDGTEVLAKPGSGRYVARG